MISWRLIGVGDRLAEGLVGVVVVEVHREDADAGDVELLEPGDARQARALGGRDADGQVELTRGELGDGDVRLLDAVVDLLDLRVLALPVALLGREPRAGRGDRRREVVGAGADHRAGDAQAEVARLGLGRGEIAQDVLRQDVVDGAREAAQEGAVGLLERDLDRVVVDLLDAARDVRRALDRVAADDALERATTPSCL